ncbi:hypothetical protein [Microbacterium aurum]|uniref:hypothetical protein n=1 Tax=Microbacterium aurum TaxID=36805 RepID=UPI0028F081A7|nr:hypothetical protein [Microbacterium aurum]
MSEHHTHQHAHEPQHDHGAAAGSCHSPAAANLPADQVAECPVMPGNMVVKTDAEAAGLVRDYEGVRYYLCCAGCGPKFDADPAVYAHAA